jgi:DNA excision repair protein ERCC-2
MIPGLDADGEELRIGITGLLELAVLPGALPQAPASDVQTRARLHRRFQRRLSAEGAETEVPLGLDLEELGISLRVSGRADALLESGGRTVLTEVKTAVRPPDSPIAQRPGHVLQLIFYALALKGSRGIRPRARLVYIPAAPDSDDEPSVRHVDVFSPACRALWDRTLRQVCGRLRDYLDRRKGLLSSLPEHAFHHRKPRPGQPAIMEAAKEAVEGGGRLLIQSPTGSGKTAAVLAGAIPPALRRGMRLLFLTSKNTQKRIVADTVAGLRGRGLDLRCLVLRSRESACPRGLPVCLPAECPYAGDFGGRILEHGLIDRLLGMGLVGPEETAQAAEAAGVCPFELSLAAARWCELIVCDLNYVYDPHVRLRRFLEEPASAALCAVLVDEAANLPDRAREYWSPSVEESWLEEVARLHGDVPGAEEALAPWRRLMGGISPADGLFACEEGDVTGELELPRNAQAWRDLANAVERPSRPLLDMLRSASDIESIGPADDPRYRLFLSRGRSGAALQWYCADASDMLEEQQRRLGAVVAFSATLSPFSHYSRQLGLEGPRQLETGYPFPRRELGLWIDPRLDTRYRRRMETLPVLARRLSTLYRRAPGTYLVYFPSYGYAEMAAEALEPLGLETVLQRRGADHVQREEMFARIAAGSGLALLVSGGVFAEGVEFRPGSLRGAVVVGPSLPALSPRRRFVRSWFDSRGEDGFEKAFLIPGAGRAVQAAGRVVRAAGQRGTVILMGRRFAQGRMLRLMPSYWFDGGGIPVLSEGMSELAEFWKENGGDPCGPPPESRQG